MNIKVSICPSTNKYNKIINQEGIRKSFTSSYQCQESQFFQLSPQSPAHNSHIKKSAARIKHKQSINIEYNLTGILSGYFSLMREASACLLSDA